MRTCYYYVLEDKNSKGSYCGYINEKGILYVTESPLCAKTFWTKEEADKYNEESLHNIFKPKKIDFAPIYEEMNKCRKLN